ncbi:hypothetical protein ACFSQJ_13220 [Croceitalea marina]|uniref:Uncharacterized protein n=1 Tax=Croceitalea marina TaxID=1775166 RepID=A0ABW5MX51_9FLAO
MKKAVHILGLLLPIVLFYACNEITADDFVLTDHNTPLHNISYKYWYPKTGKTLKKDEVFVVKAAKKGDQKKLWIVTSYGNTSKKAEPIYLRRKKMENGNFVFQVTSWDTGKNISLFLGNMVNDSTIHFFGYTDAAMEYAAKSNLLNDFKGHVLVKKDKISFDSIAANDHKAAILDFITSLSDATYEEDIIVFTGTNNERKITSLISQ